MEKNTQIIQSPFKKSLSLTNFYIMKNSSHKNHLFGNYILNPYYHIRSHSIISNTNNKNTQTNVKTYDIGIQCNLENNDSENTLRTKIVEDEWLFVKDKDI